MKEASLQPEPSPDTEIVVDNLSVDLPLYNLASLSLKMQVLNLAVGGRLSQRMGRVVVVKALDQLSFSAMAGDRIGVLGHNGSGKTTLLKVLCGIYEPTGGSLRSRFDIVPVLDVSVAIDDEMTGLEAIRMGCLLRGFAQKETQEYLPDIVEFSELGDFISLPLRTYSTGMRARLIFAIATCKPLDAIAIDEGIGAGDARFIAKAHKRIEDFLSRASVLFIASHSAEMLRTFCNKGMVLKSGRLYYLGGIEDAIKAYTDADYWNAS